MLDNLSLSGSLNVDEDPAMEHFARLLETSKSLEVLNMGTAVGHRPFNLYILGSDIVFCDPQFSQVFATFHTNKPKQAIENFKLWMKD